MKRQLLIAAAGLVSVPALAQSALDAGDAEGGQPFFAEVYASGERSDNPTQRDVSGSRSGDIYTVGLNTQMFHDGRKLDYGLSGNLAWVDYSDQTFDATSDGSLSGLARWGERSDVFQWTVRDTLSQSRFNAFANATPDNREYVNSLSTGPTLNFRLSSQLLLRLDGVYGLRSYEDSPLDSTAIGGGAALSRLLGGDSFVSLNVRSTKIEYDNDLIAILSDYDLREYYLSYLSGARRSLSWQADVGYTQVEGQTFDSSSPLFRLQLQRQLNSAYWSISAEQQNGDAASGFGSDGFQSGDLAGNFAGNSPLTAAPGNYGDTALSAPGARKSRGVDATYGIIGRRTDVTLSVGYRDESYPLTQLLDRSSTRFRVALDRRMRSTLSAQLSAEYRLEDFDAPGLPEANYLDTRFSLTQQLGRRLSLSALVGYSRRDDKGSAFEFAEWRYGLRLNYLLTERTSGARGGR